MRKATLRQGQQILNIVAQSGLGRAGIQALLRSGRLAALCREFVPATDSSGYEYPEPTISPITLDFHTGLSLVQLRDSGKYDFVNLEMTKKNFPTDVKFGTQELWLVCFNREIHDSEEPERSELLRELDRLGFKPEGAFELCTLGRQHPHLQLQFQVVARRQACPDPNGGLVCPVLGRHTYGRALDLSPVERTWLADCRFLCSRK